MVARWALGAGYTDDGLAFIQTNYGTPSKYVSYVALAPYFATADDTNPAIAQIVNQMVELSQQLIADIIQRGINNGEFNPSWNYKEFATIMFAMIEGGVR